MKIKMWTPIIPLLFLFNLFLAAGCTQAAAQKTTQPILSPATTSPSASDIPTISTRDAYDLIQRNISNPGFVIIDVRTADEFNSGHMASAINLDYYSPEFKSNISTLDKNKRYLIYCRTGIRGEAATTMMIDLGFKEVQNLGDGIVQWVQDGYPIIN